ncbi:MAG: GNAT family N-acetyltransferase [Bacteroidota bacterium]
MYINIETERLQIRPIDLADAVFILDLVNSEGWLKFIGDRNVTDKDDAVKYIQRILDNPNFFYSVFELKASKKPIGIVTFLHRENEKFPDIGFALLPEYEGNGYTYEAAKAYIVKIISLHQHERIIAITKPDNQKSINLLRKLGLKYQGDHSKGEEVLSYYSLIADA